MNPIKSHERSSRVFYDEEIKFFSPLLLANRPFITSSNDSFVPAFPRPKTSPPPPPPLIITFSSERLRFTLNHESNYPRLTSQSLTSAPESAHRFSPGAKFNPRTRRSSGVIKPKGGGVRPRFERRANVSEKHCERIWSGRGRGREISRGIALNPIAVLNNRIKPGPENRI